MSRRSDAVQSLTLIIGSAFAAVFVTSVAMTATERPMETPPAPTEVTTVVLKPMSASGFMVGKVEAVPREEAGASRSIVVRGSNATGPVVFVDGVRVEGTTTFEGLLRDVNPSFKVNIQPISDAPRDAGSRSGGNRPDGNDR